MTPAASTMNANDSSPTSPRGRALAHAGILERERKSGGLTGCRPELGEQTSASPVGRPCRPRGMTGSRPGLLASPPRKGRRGGYDGDLARDRREQRHDSQRQRRADRCWPSRHLPLPPVSGVFPRSDRSRLVIRRRFGNLTAHDPRCLWAPAHRCRRGPGCPQVAFRAVVRGQADAVDRRFAAPVRPWLARRA